jgi:hypothetical protein
MMRPIRKCASLTVVTAGLAIFGLAACGSSKPSAASAGKEVVARVGTTPITRAAISHWMTTLVGGDYYELSGSHLIPAGLVSDPPDYSGCESRLEAVAAHSPSTEAKPTGTQISTKCRQLYQAMRHQAAAYLVQAQWLINTYAALGITVTDQEVQQELARWSAENKFNTEAQRNQFLALQRRSLADELLLMRLDVLGQKAEKEIHHEGKAFVAKLTETEQKWTSKTTCTAGYVVQHCRQFTSEPAPTAALPPSSILVEQIAALATGRCINLEACGKQ